jgi:porin
MRGNNHLIGCFKKLMGVLFTVLFLMSLKPLYSQVGVEDKILTLETSVTGDFVNNFHGGMKKGFAYLGVESILLTFNTEAAGLWKGGTLIMHGMNTHGAQPSSELTGDFQVFSNIEAGDHTGFYELAYFQKLGRFTLLLGQHDLNTEFVVTQSADLFINSSYGIMPVLSLNVPTSIFPVTAPCVALRWEPEGLWTFRTAVYDGNPGDIQSNRYNLSWKMGKDEGLFWIGEAEMDRSHGGIGKGTLKIGAFYHSGILPDPVDTSLNWHGDYGSYLTLHRILKVSNGIYTEGVNAFFQFGVAPREQNLAAFFASAGIRSHGFIPERKDDIVGLSIAHLGTGDRWSSASADHLRGETSVEFTYHFQINDIYSIQPDFQYLIHPGAQKSNSNAFVGMIRFGIGF